MKKQPFLPGRFASDRVGRLGQGLERGMLGPIVEPEAIRNHLESLQEHHVADIAPRQALVLVLEGLGLSAGEIGIVLGVSRHTVANQASRVRMRCVPPTIDVSRASASAWTWMHRDCCVATAWATVTSV